MTLWSGAAKSPGMKVGQTFVKLFSPGSLAGGDVKIFIPQSAVVESEADRWIFGDQIPDFVVHLHKSGSQRDAEDEALIAVGPVEVASGSADACRLDVLTERHEYKSGFIQEISVLLSLETESKD